jgi:hypothetical protein
MRLSLMVHETAKHANDVTKLVTPYCCFARCNVSEIARIATPESRLLCRAHGHHQIARELHFGTGLPACTFRNQRANGLRCPSQLIGKAAILFDLWPAKAGVMDGKRKLVGTLEDIEIFVRPMPALVVLHLYLFWSLFTGDRSLIPQLRCMALAPLHCRRKDPYLDQ